MSPCSCMCAYQFNIRIWYQSSFTITVASALCHGSTDICTCKRLIPTSLRKPTAEPGRCTRRRPSMWGLENTPPAPEERDLFFILTFLYGVFSDIFWSTNVLALCTLKLVDDFIRTNWFQKWTNIWQHVILFACSGTQWACIKVHISSPCLCQYLKLTAGQSYLETTDADKQGLRRSQRTMPDLSQRWAVHKRELLGKYQPAAINCEHPSTTINNLRRMHPFSAHCRRFLVRGWCCAKSFGSEILAQAWMRSQQSGVLPAEGIMRLGWWVTVKYVKNHSRVFVMWTYNDSSFQSMRAKNLPTTYDNLWTDWYFANKTWISRSHFHSVSKSISTSDCGLQEPNMTSQPLDFPGTSYQLSQGACLLLFNVDHMLMFFCVYFPMYFPKHPGKSCHSDRWSHHDPHPLMAPCKDSSNTRRSPGSGLHTLRKRFLSSRKPR